MNSAMAASLGGEKCWLPIGGRQHLPSSRAPRSGGPLLHPLRFRSVTDQWPGREHAERDAVVVVVERIQLLALRRLCQFVHLVAQRVRLLVLARRVLAELRRAPAQVVADTEGVEHRPGARLTV